MPFVQTMASSLARLGLGQRVSDGDAATQTTDDLGDNDNALITAQTPVEECDRADARSWAEPGRTTATLSSWRGRGGMQTVELDWTPCHFGGERPWFRFPGCGRRAGILYDTADGFLCRRCGNFAYQMENETRTGRKILKAKRLRVRLGGTGNLLETLPGKPPDMSERTYERLRARSERADQAACSALPRETGRQQSADGTVGERLVKRTIRKLWAPTLKSVEKVGSR